MHRCAILSLFQYRSTRWLLLAAPLSVFDFHEHFLRERWDIPLINAKEAHKRWEILRWTYSLQLLRIPDHIVTMSLGVSSRLELLNRRASLQIPQMVLSNSMWSLQEIIDEVLILILQHGRTRWSLVSSGLKHPFRPWFIFLLYAKIQDIPATRQTRTFSLKNFVWSITISRRLFNYFNNV